MSTTCRWSFWCWRTGSRHGAPVRLHHSTASTKLRSSRPGRPARFLMPSAALILCHCRSSNCKRTIVDTPWSTPAAQSKARSSEWLTKVGSPCAPSWARRARARPAPPTSAYQTNGPNDSSRTVGHGHGHVYGHARATPNYGHALERRALEPLDVLGGLELGRGGGALAEEELLALGHPQALPRLAREIQAILVDQHLGVLEPAAPGLRRNVVEHTLTELALEGRLLEAVEVLVELHAV